MRISRVTIKNYRNLNGSSHDTLYDTLYDTPNDALYEKGASFRKESMR